MSRALLATAAGEAKPKQFLQQLIERVGWTEIVKIGTIMLAAIILVLVFKHYVIGRLTKLAEQTETDVDDRLVFFLSRLYKGLIAFVTLLIVLRILKVELTPLLAGAGIAGIAVAYASKDIIGNFLSGVFLLIDRPIKIGDRILIERIGTDWGSWGDVVDVGLRSTTVANTDGVHVTYPNAKLAESVIRNFSPNDDPIRFRVRVLVDYSADVEGAIEALVAVAQAQPDVLSEPPPKALLRSLYGGSSNATYDGALLELRCFVPDIRVRTSLRSRLLVAIKKSFDDQGFTFAHPKVAVQPQTTGRRDDLVAED
jgi:small-conductance mechanosensitive channel